MKPTFCFLPRPGCPAAPPASHLIDFADVEQHSLLQLEPPDHTRLRKRVNRAFVARQIDSMAPDIETLVNQCIEKLDKRIQVAFIDVDEAFDVYAYLKCTVFDI